MGAIEREIDRYADEMGLLEARENRSEKRFIDEREGLAESLASGHEVQVSQGVTLDFDAVMENLFHRDEQVKSAYKLCMMNSGVGGLHIKRMITEIAQELIDDYAKEFKAEMEKFYEH